MKIQLMNREIRFDGWAVGDLREAGVAPPPTVLAAFEEYLETGIEDAAERHENCYGQREIADAESEGRDEGRLEMKAKVEQLLQHWDLAEISIEVRKKLLAKIDEL